jgi:hypothetical protein
MRRDPTVTAATPSRPIRCHNKTYMPQHRSRPEVYRAPEPCKRHFLTSHSALEEMRLTLRFWLIGRERQVHRQPRDPDERLLSWCPSDPKASVTRVTCCEDRLSSAGQLDRCLYQGVVAVAAVLLPVGQPLAHDVHRSLVVHWSLKRVGIVELPLTEPRGANHLILTRGCTFSFGRRQAGVDATAASCSSCTLSLGGSLPI